MNFSDEIKKQLDAEQVFSFYGIEPNRAGFVSCPLHREKTASLKVYSGERGWHCFGCGEGGDIIKFVMLFFNLSFPDAISKLNDDFCLGLPIGKRLTLRQKREFDKVAAQRLAEREEKRKERDRLLSEYSVALDKFCKYDKIIAQSKREGFTDISEFGDDLAEALRNFGTARFYLDEAEMRLRSFENR